MNFDMKMVLVWMQIDMDLNAYECECKITKGENVTQMTSDNLPPFFIEWWTCNDHGHVIETEFEQRNGLWIRMRRPWIMNTKPWPWVKKS